jgi:hypothetical protein
MWKEWPRSREHCKYVSYAQLNVVSKKMHPCKRLVVEGTIPGHTSLIRDEQVYNYRRARVPYLFVVQLQLNMLKTTHVHTREATPWFLQPLTCYDDPASISNPNDPTTILASALHDIVSVQLPQVPRSTLTLSAKHRRAGKRSWRSCIT